LWGKGDITDLYGKEKKCISDSIMTWASAGRILGRKTKSARIASEEGGHAAEIEEQSRKRPVKIWQPNLNRAKKKVE